MGQTYLIVSWEKRQFLDPGRFGENSKKSGLFQGLHAKALALLVCNARPTFDHEMVGAWAGDSIALVGDYDDDQWHRVKNEFEDTSLRGIAMLCSEDPLIDELIEKAKRDESLFVELGNVIHTVGCSRLEDRLYVEFGPQWRSRYKELFVGD